MSDLFESVVAEENEGRRALTASAMLKAYALGMANEIMQKIPTADAEFIEQVRLSQSDTAALDAFVKEQCGARLNNSDIAMLDEDEVKRLLKSNQSNRSRRKGLAMTQSNYVELLTAAIAEWVLRESCGITKGIGVFGGTNRGPALVINETTLAAFAEDQEALGRAIRNVQSKRSTYKRNHLDDPTYTEHPEWIELQQQLDALRAVRVTGQFGRKGFSMKKALKFIFKGVGDPATLDRDTCVKIITACKKLSNGEYPQEFVDMVTAQQEREAAEALQAEEDAAESVYSE